MEHDFKELLKNDFQELSKHVPLSTYGARLQELLKKHFWELLNKPTFRA